MFAKLVNLPTSIKAGALALIGVGLVGCETAQPHGGNAYVGRVVGGSPYGRTTLPPAPSGYQEGGVSPLAQNRADRDYYDIKSKQARKSGDLESYRDDRARYYQAQQNTVASVAPRRGRGRVGLLGGMVGALLPDAPPIVTGVLGFVDRTGGLAVDRYGRGFSRQVEKGFYNKGRSDGAQATYNLLGAEAFTPNLRPYRR